MAQKERSPKVEAPSGLDQIREIIFGDQMNEIHRQIEELNQKYGALQHKIELLATKQADFDQRLTEALEQQRATQQDQHQTRAVIEQLKTEFDQRIAQLDQAKVDKSQIGQAFIEWGMKVKQTGLNQG